MSETFKILGANQGKIIEKLLFNACGSSDDAQWMFTNKIACKNAMEYFFHEAINQSLSLDPKYESIIYTNDIKNNDIIGHSRIIYHNRDIKSNDNNEFLTLFRIIENIIITLKISLLPVRIGFKEFFKMLLFIYNYKMVTNIILREFAPFVQFNCFFITKKYQTKGYGTKLFKYLCKKVKCNSIVNGDRIPCIFVQATDMSLNFWKNIGFIVVGSIQNIYYNDELMVYLLIYHEKKEILNELKNKCIQYTNKKNQLNLIFDDKNKFINIWPPTKIDIMLYLLQFGWIKYLYKYIMGFNKIKNYKTILNYKSILKLILIIFFIFIFGISLIPVLFLFLFLRYVRLFAWDVS